MATDPPQGSPYGSPQAQGHPGGLPQGFSQAAASPQGTAGLTEMAELARAAISAAAAEAARAATQASSASSSDKKKDWSRLIPRPSTFAPADRDQEVSLWRDWFWGLRQYLLVVDGKYQDDLDYLERADRDEVDFDLLDEEEQHRGRFLYSLLSTLLQGRLLSLVRSVDRSNGLEALRQLLMNCQPKARNRTMSMLQGIMSYPMFNMKGSIIAQVVRLEESFSQFEKLGGKLTDEMKAAVVLKCITGPLKVHLNLSLTESSSYAKVREVIQAYDTATTKWTDSTITSFPLQPLQDSTGVIPMEVDKVKGKGGGKGKSKGKDGKGKQKGKDQKGKGKSQNQGQWTASSSTSWTSTSKGSGRTRKVRTTRAKARTKARKPMCASIAVDQAIMRKTVGEHGKLEAQMDLPLCLQLRQHRKVLGPSASQINPGLSVKRVSVQDAGDSSSSHVTFDLRGSNASSWEHVRNDDPCVRAVQFFYIDDELKEPASVRSTTSMQSEMQTFEMDESEVSIIIDSGADAPVFPASMIHCGKEHPGQTVALQDAQGRQIPTLGQKAMSVLPEDVNGTEIELLDNVIFSNEINQPILSYGRLMNAGCWSICAETKCLRNGIYEVPLEFQNHSLVVKAHVRAVNTVPCAIRALKADLSDGLQGYVDNTFGWNKEGNRWIGVHLSAQHQNPLFVPNIDYTVEWFRTTLIKKDQAWLMVEFCEKISEMLDLELPIEETAGRTTVVTFLTDGFEDVEAMGFQVEGGVAMEELEALEMQIQPLLDIPEDVELEQPEAAEGEEAHVEGGQLLDPPLEGDGQGHQQVQLQHQVPQEGYIVVGEVIPDQIEVNGQVRTALNSLATLRAACGG
eukprot:s1934_g8.t1